MPLMLIAQPRRDGGTMLRVKWFIVQVLDVIGFRILMRAGEVLVGWSSSLDKRWKTGVWKEWHDDGESDY